MKGSLCVFILAAAFQVAVLQESEAECSKPTPTECAGANLCETSHCPRYTSKKCCVELVNGECAAQFYRLPSLKLVTDKCFQGIESCSDKLCSQHRTCVEEVVDCPDERPDCGIHRVNAVCVLNEVARPPSNCDEIVCGDGATCVVSESGRGTRVECQEIVPKSCEELECDEGMHCVERAKPRCVPIRSEVRPSNCSQLECPESLVCMLLDGDRGAKCANPPVPTSCTELECDPGLACEQVGRTGRVRCVYVEPPPPRTLPPLPPTRPGFTGELPTRVAPPPPIRIARRCDEIDCEPGYQCRLVINPEINLNKQPVATCMPIECPLRRRARPPVNCEEISCERDEMCMLCGEGRETRARCMRRDPRDEEDRENMTRPMRREDRDDVTRPNQRVDGRTMRRSPAFCTELVCGSENKENCQEFKFEDGRPQRALCIPLDSPDSCNEVDCDEENETCIELQNEEVKVARCIPTSTKPEGTRVPATRGERPTRPALPERPRPAVQCAELDCGRGFECLHVRRDGRRRAMCVQRRRDEVCRPAPRRPDDRDSCIPTSRPDRERPTGERPTERLDRERPTSRPELIGGSDSERLLGTYDYDLDRDIHSSDEDDGYDILDGGPGEDIASYKVFDKEKLKKLCDGVYMYMGDILIDVEIIKDGNGTMIRLDELFSNSTRPKGNEGESGSGEKMELDENGNLKKMEEEGVDISTAVHRPDLCMERRCCEGESCFVRKIADNLPPLAFCAPDDFKGTRPPMPPPPTCEELMCDEGFICVEGGDRERRIEEEGNRSPGGVDGRRHGGNDNRRPSNEGDKKEDGRRSGAVCIRRRPNRPDRPTGRPMPTRVPDRLRPTRGPDRPRPTGPPDRLRPTRGPVRPPRPNVPIERAE